MPAHTKHTGSKSFQARSMSILAPRERVACAGGRVWRAQYDRTPVRCRQRWGDSARLPLSQPIAPRRKTVCRAPCEVFGYRLTTRKTGNLAHRLLTARNGFLSSRTLRDRSGAGTREGTGRRGSAAPLRSHKQEFVRSPAPAAPAARQPLGPNPRVARCCRPRRRLFAHALVSTPTPRCTRPARPSSPIARRRADDDSATGGPRPRGQATPPTFPTRCKRGKPDGPPGDKSATATTERRFHRHRPWDGARPSRLVDQTASRAKRRRRGTTPARHACNRQHTAGAHRNTADGVSAKT